MVKKRNLSIQKIIETSISLINEKGLEALTMRKLARKLNVQASAVYWHVKNKEELLQLLSINISKKISYRMSSWTGNRNWFTCLNKAEMPWHPSEMDLK